MLNLELSHKIITKKIDENIFQAFENSIKEGDLKTLKFVLKNGIDIKIFKPIGCIWASEYGNLNILKYLEDEDPTPDNFRSHNYLAFRVSCLKGNFDILKYLELKGFIGKHIKLYIPEIIAFTENNKNPELLEYLKNRNYL